MTSHEIDEDPVISVLDKILEALRAGIVRYAPYALMVFRSNRIPPIVSRMRSEATESLAHETQAWPEYYRLLDLVAGCYVWPEAYARSMRALAETHCVRRCEHPATEVMF